MTEQAEQKSEQAANEPKSVADWSMDEVRAEIARLDQELAQEPQALEKPSSQGRAPSTNRGETLAREAQAARRDLIRQFESIDSDERFTDEHRAEAVWQAYDKSKPIIEEKAKTARETLLKDAEHHEISSIPLPPGQSLRTNNVELLGLSQGERSRIVERINHVPPNIARMRSAGKNIPASAENKPANILREEFARGLDIGGPQGGAICRAVINLAEDRGISVDDICDSYRTDWQRNHLESAQNARVQAQSIYSRVPLPAYKRPGGPRSPEEARAGKRRSALGLTKKAGSAIPQKKQRKPHWK